MKPEVEQSGGMLRFRWHDEHIQMIVNRIHEHRDGRVTAEVRVLTDRAGYAPHIHQAQMNLLATKTRTELAKYLGERYEAPWSTMLEQMCVMTLQRIRMGEPIVEISTIDDIQPPEYLLHPVLPKGHPTVLFGMGGTGKSYLALAMAVAILLPWQDNKLGLRTGSQSTRVLYLDYETDSYEIGWRLRCLRAGMNLPHVWLHYRRCSLPIADDVEAIQKAALDLDVGAVVVDSVGLAGGGDLNAPETAIRLFSALRQLRVTSLLIAHASKNQSSDKSTPFGSVYFLNLARSVWEVRKSQEAGDKSIHVGLFHRKSNVSEQFRPLGFRIEFGDESTRIVRQDVTEVVELSEHLSQTARVEALLRGGQMTAKEVAECLDVSESQARVVLHRLAKRGVVVKIGDNHWGLKHGA